MLAERQDNLTQPTGMHTMTMGTEGVVIARAMAAVEATAEATAEVAEAAAPKLGHPLGLALEVGALPPWLSNNLCLGVSGPRLASVRALASKLAI
jgi:hypothetical protein